MTACYPGNGAAEELYHDPIVEAAPPLSREVTNHPHILRWDFSNLNSRKHGSQPWRESSFARDELSTMAKIASFTASRRLAKTTGVARLHNGRSPPLRPNVPRKVHGSEPERTGLLPEWPEELSYRARRDRTWTARQASLRGDPVPSRSFQRVPDSSVFQTLGAAATHT